jgi:hypothetical protein
MATFLDAISSSPSVFKPVEFDSSGVKKFAENLVHSYQYFQEKKKEGKAKADAEIYEYQKGVLNENLPIAYSEHLIGQVEDSKKELTNLLLENDNNFAYIAANKPKELNAIMAKINDPQGLNAGRQTMMEYASFQQRMQEAGADTLVKINGEYVPKDVNYLKNVLGFDIPKEIKLAGEPGEFMTMEDYSKLAMNFKALGPDNKTLTAIPFDKFSFSTGSLDQEILTKTTRQQDVTTSDDMTEGSLETRSIFTKKTTASNVEKLKEAVNHYSQKNTLSPEAEERIERNFLANTKKTADGVVYNDALYKTQDEAYNAYRRNYIEKISDIHKKHDKETDKSINSAAAGSGGKNNSAEYNTMLQLTAGSHPTYEYGQPVLLTDGSQGTRVDVFRVGPEAVFYAQNAVGTVESDEYIIEGFKNPIKLPGIVTEVHSFDRVVDKNGNIRVLERIKILVPDWEVTDLLELESENYELAYKQNRASTIGLVDSDDFDLLDPKIQKAASEELREGATFNNKDYVELYAHRVAKPTWGYPSDSKATKETTAQSQRAVLAQRVETTKQQREQEILENELQKQISGNQLTR